MSPRAWALFAAVSVLWGVPYLMIKVAVEEGQTVAAGDLVVVLEAMKMENPVAAHKDGIVTGLAVEPGTAVTQGTVLLEIKSDEA